MNVISGPKEEEQYRETDQMTERERQLVAKMKKSAERLDRIKNGDKKYRRPPSEADRIIGCYRTLYF